MTTLILFVGCSVIRSLLSWCSKLLCAWMVLIAQLLKDNILMVQNEIQLLFNLKYFCSLFPCILLQRQLNLDDYTIKRINCLTFLWLSTGSYKLVTNSRYCIAFITITHYICKSCRFMCLLFSLGGTNRIQLGAWLNLKFNLISLNFLYILFRF